MVLCAHDYLNADLDLLNPDTQQGLPNVAWPIEGETFLGFHLLRKLGRGALRAFFWLPSRRSAIAASR